MMNTSHEGGLLFFGDAPAAQGDSEYTGLADESAADVVSRCHVEEQRQVPGILRVRDSREPRTDGLGEER